MAYVFFAATMRKLSIREIRRKVEREDNHPIEYYVTILSPYTA